MTTGNRRAVGLRPSCHRLLLAALAYLAVVLLTPLRAQAAGLSLDVARVAPAMAPKMENGGCSGVLRLHGATALRAVHWRGPAYEVVALGACVPLLPRGATYVPVAFSSGSSTLEVAAAAQPEPRREPPESDGVARVTDVPILMYHHIGEVPYGADSIRHGLTVSEANFRDQLRHLKDAGYETITVAQLVDHLATGAELPARPIVITLDDGYRDAYEVALPALQEFGYVATFFLLTAPIDEGQSEFVTWEQVYALHEAGMEMGAHTYTHPDLRGKSTDYIVWQVLGSKEAIEARIGEPVRVFAYPSGAHDEHAVQVVRSAQFWAALTTEASCRQTPAGLWTMGRVRIQPGDTVRTFAQKLEACRAP